MTKCADCGKEVSIWTAYNVNDKYYCKDCGSRREEAERKKKEALEAKERRTAERESEIQEKKTRESGFWSWVWGSPLRVVANVIVIILVFGSVFGNLARIPDNNPFAAAGFLGEFIVWVFLSVLPWVAAYLLVLLIAYSMLTIKKK